MRKSIFQIFQDGQRYAHIWPRHAVVAAMTESVVVPAVNFAARWLPPVAVINFVVQWQWQGESLLPQAIVTSLFILSLPLQGWYWLGRRANTQLTPQLKHWYQQLASKLKMEPRKQPNYMDLAVMLRKALRELPPDEH